MVPVIYLYLLSTCHRFVTMSNIANIKVILQMPWGNCLTSITPKRKVLSDNVKMVL